METRERRKIRNRNRVKAMMSTRKRLSVFRSNKNIFAQIIDDITGVTIASASSLEKELVDKNKKNEKKDKFITEQKVGDLIAQRSIKKGINKVVFDKGLYKFHGRIRALAESARKSGLKF